MFTWKRHKDIFKGEGIYHLTFVVHERAAILGELQMSADGKAQIIPSALGSAISQDLNALSNRRPYCRLLAKQLMPDHIHVLIWITEDRGVSIKEIARGMRQGWGQMARGFTIGDTEASASTAVNTAAVNINRQMASAVNTEAVDTTAVDINRQMASAVNTEAADTTAVDTTAVDINRQMASADADKLTPIEQQPTAQTPAPVAQPPLFSAPFIRTLSRKGQLKAMIAYIHDNPRRAMLRRLHPDLFRLRREVQVEGLTFTALGNLFLLDYPDRQAVVCSRTAPEERIAALQASTLQGAEAGAVTFSGAVSKGEKQMVRAVREAGWPVVVLLNEGFPAAGTEQERYYKPGGVYFEACAAGRLLLLEATATTLEDPRVVALTDQALRDKAEAKHQDYTPMPHSAQRWRMMANNTIVGMLIGNGIADNI